MSQVRTLDIERDDRALHDFLRTLDPATLYARFLGVGDASIAWLESGLRRQREHRALVTFVGTRMIGLLDYVAEDALEFGLVVAANMRRRRVAATMLERLISRTVDEGGATRLVADCDPANVSARALLRAFKFETDGARRCESTRFVLRVARAEPD